jgi:hypothetical protein
MTALASAAGAAVAGRRRRRLWGAALALVGALIIVRNLCGLDSAPLGAYVDETSIGYNAWAISTHAVDEHGAHLPLYFTAFGEYKNPVYIYTLSAVLRVLPLTVATERLPAALFGLLTCLFITLIAWRRAHALAGGGQLLLPSTLDQPYIQAAFVFMPQPPQRFIADSVTPLLAAMHMALIDPNVPPTQSGAIAVLSSVDPVPAHAQRLFEEVTPAATLAFGAPPPRYITIVVYRLH